MESSCEYESNLRSKEHYLSSSEKFMPVQDLNP